MKPLNRIIAKASASPQRIVLAEGADPRIVEAAQKANADKLASITLIGARDEILAQISKQGGDPAHFNIVDPHNSDYTAPFTDRYLEIRRRKGIDAAQARAAMLDPVGFSAMFLREGHADGMIAGAVATTAHTVRTAFQIIGKKPGIKTVSSFFLMLLCETGHTKKGGFIFSDCGLVVEPDTEELASIALAAAQSCETLLGEVPRIAMLSFSTMGSAAHEKVSRVQAATEIIRTKRPDLNVDGELQFDAAFVPLVNSMKAPGSSTGGNANVLIFPNLDAGNIGYKIAQRIGGAIAIGPILQGLAKPVNDLSRGCTPEDIYNLIAVTSLQAASSG